MSAAPGWIREHVRPGEEILWWARPSLVGLAPILGSAALGLAYIFVSLRFGLEQPSLLQLGRTSAVLVAVAGVLFEAARRFVKLRFTTYVVTRERFYVVTSFFSVDARSVPLSRLAQVSLRRGVFGALLGFWSAHVGAYGGERGFSIAAIRDGEGLLREAGSGLRRGANASWLLRGD